MALTEKEMVGWIYKQVQSGSKSQADLRAAFDADFDSSPDELITFLYGCKHFRKTGVGDQSAWMISANREDDLREFLAD